MSSASPCALAALPAACAATSRAPVRRRLIAAVHFALGTTTALTTLGVASALIGRSLSLGLRTASIAFGLVLIAAGIVTTAGTAGGPRATSCPTIGRPARTTPPFLFGLILGALMTPCATPILVAILAVLAAGADPLRGAAFMFAYSVGHCALILAAALSWGMVQSALERYSPGLELARKAGGLFLCAAGTLLIQSVL